MLSSFLSFRFQNKSRRQILFPVSFYRWGWLSEWTELRAAESGFAAGGPGPRAHGCCHPCPCYLFQLVLVTGLAQWMCPKDKMGHGRGFKAVLSGIVLLPGYLSQTLKAWVWKRTKHFREEPRREKGMRQGQARCDQGHWEACVTRGRGQWHKACVGGVGWSWQAGMIYQWCWHTRAQRKHSEGRVRWALHSYDPEARLSFVCRLSHQALSYWCWPEGMNYLWVLVIPVCSWHQKWISFFPEEGCRDNNFIVNSQLSVRK